MALLILQVLLLFAKTLSFHAMRIKSRVSLTLTPLDVGAPAHALRWLVFAIVDTTNNIYVWSNKMVIYLLLIVDMT